MAVAAEVAFRLVLLQQLAQAAVLAVALGQSQVFA